MLNTVCNHSIYSVIICFAMYLRLSWYKMFNMSNNRLCLPCFVYACSGLLVDFLFGNVFYRQRPQSPLVENSFWWLWSKFMCVRLVLFSSLLKSSMWRCFYLSTSQFDTGHTYLYAIFLLRCTLLKYIFFGSLAMIHFAEVHIWGGSVHTYWQSC